MTRTAATSRLRLALAHVPVRLAGAAVAVAALAASLLAAAPPAGAAALAAGAQAARVSSPGVDDTAAPVVWDGSYLITAAASPDGALYVYEQVPGATSWSRQLVAAGAPDGDAPLGPPSLTVTSTAVQVVSEDPGGGIWFFQQILGQSTWSTGQLVGAVSQGNPEGTQYPKIAWTGVTGHTGTNSVIAVADGAGTIRYWYQNGGGWTGETVAAGTAQNEFYGVALTATDRGIVIVAAGTTGGFESFYQSYGSPAPWASDGTLAEGAPGMLYGSMSVTWDGVNVDVAVTDQSTIMILWKADSGTIWNAVLGGSDPGGIPITGPINITYTGTNLLLTALQQVSSSQQRLVFWWQQVEDGEYANFNPENVGTVTVPDGYGTPDLAYTSGSSLPEAVIVAPYTTNSHATSALRDWTEPYGGSDWTRHTVTPA